MDLLPNPFGLAVLAALFIALERRFPYRPSPLRRRGWKTDAVHLVVTHTLEQLSTLALVVLVWFPLQAVKSERLAAWVAAQPRLLVAVVALLLADLLGYWWHRLEHVVPFLWRFHAIHHSSERLDWLAGLRRHPVAASAGKVVTFVVLTLLGVPKDILGGGVVLLGLWAVLLHANVRFRFFPLRAFVATPDFHHWHHARVDAGPGWNFAGLFPVWDRLFGTYLVPEGRPLLYGTDTDVPEGYLAQLKAPFLAPKPPALAVTPAGGAPPR
jgi:sterol desaturase/sphingolipid hydroxylase (fatty acid hydroxylase superfamily)